MQTVMQFLKTLHHLENYATANNDNNEKLFETMVTVHDSPQPPPPPPPPPPSSMTPVLLQLLPPPPPPRSFLFPLTCALLASLWIIEIRTMLFSCLVNVFRDVWLLDTSLCVCFHFAKAGVSDVEALTDMEDDHNLLCMESFDLTDVTDPPLNERFAYLLWNYRFCVCFFVFVGPTCIHWFFFISASVPQAHRFLKFKPCWQNVLKLLL